MQMQDFLKNNRGINDGADLPEDYMSELYDRIINNEIKMKVHTHPMHSETLLPFPFALLSFSRGCGVDVRRCCTGCGCCGPDGRHCSQGRRLDGHHLEPHPRPAGCSLQ